MNKNNYIPALSFNFLTGYYDWAIKKVMPGGFREIFVRQIQPSPQEVILDFGTGTAEIAILLKKETPEAVITAIDIDPKVLRIAKRKILQQKLDIDVHEIEEQVFPLQNDYFDKVVSCLVFHHLSPGQKRIALDEIHRVLKAGGKIYVADWGLERNKLKARFLRAFKYFNAIKYIAEQGEGLLPQYFENAGFKNVRETGYIKAKTGTLCYYEGEK